MSEHYGCAVVPARVRRPRDKASVEMGVGLIERQAMLALRGRRFMSLGEFNSALADQVAAINSRPFQRREGSRESVFLAQEKLLLIPLPATPYEMTARKEVTVNFNYHVCFDGCWYSVPFEFVKRTVAVVATARTVSVMADGTRIAMHERAHGKGEYRTNPDTCRMPTGTTPNGTARGSGRGPRASGRPPRGRSGPSCRRAGSSSSRTARAAPCSPWRRPMEGSFWRKRAKRPFSGRRGPATRL